MPQLPTATPRKKFTLRILPHRSYGIIRVAFVGTAFARRTSIYREIREIQREPERNGERVVFELSDSKKSVKRNHRKNK